MIDLDNLTETQKQVMDKFVDAMLCGKEVSYLNFPSVSQQEFIEIAEAVLSAAGCKNASAGTARH